MNSPPDWSSMLGREMQEQTENDGCCSSSECVAAFTTDRSRITRVALSSADARWIEPYLAKYNSYLENRGETASTIQLSQLPATEELYKDIRHDLKSRSGLYDGFIIPPILMGDLLGLEGVAALSLSESDSAVGGMAQIWNDLLPYYKEQVASLEGQIYGMPLLGGNMPLLLYRKDYLEAFNLSVPVTWGEYIRVASTLHNQNLAPDGTGIFGSCMGRMSRAICRRQMNVEAGRNCVSMSITYMGMMLASMTQSGGSSSGWLFDTKLSGEMIPLLDPTLDNVLIFMEQQLKFGAPDELISDSSMNLELFREGKCAMTFALDHPKDLLDSPEIGFAPVPGAHTFLDRESMTLLDCTKESCPYGEQNDEWGIVNHAPFGSDHMMVGSISAFASSNARDEVYDFFSYIAQQRENINVTGEREQPTTYSSLEESTVTGYASVIRGLTESNNTVAPLRIPHSFSLLSVLDNQVHDYLMVGNFSNDTRRRVRQRVEASLQRMIRQYDTINRRGPMVISYEKSLNNYSPARSPDLYIGRTDRMIGWSLGGIGCFCSIFFAFWVWRNKESSVVRGSQEIFLNMLCLGTFLMACCIFLFGVDDHTSSTEFASRACMGSTWLYSLGYVILVSALSSKILLINRIFRKAKNLQRILIGWGDILWPFGILGSLNTVILATWNVHDPAVWERATVDETQYSGSLEESASFGSCNCDNFRIYFGLVVAVNFGFSVVALVQAYECRKILTDFLESIYISASLGCIVQVWTVGLPLFKLLDGDPRGLFFVKSGVVFLTSVIPLLFIFLPKIGYERDSHQGRSHEHGHDPSSTTHQGDHSITSHDSEMSKGRKGKGEGRNGPDRTEGGKQKRIIYPRGVRIIHTSNRHVEEVEKLQRSLRHAESRHRTLSDRFERLQEKLDHYMVSRDPDHEFNNSNLSKSNNFILAARSESVVPHLPKHPKM